MDGLLIDSEPLWKRINKETYGRLGVKLTENDRQRMMGRTQIENAKFLYEQYKWERYSPQEVNDMIIEAMVAAVKKDLKLMPGVHQALQVCKKASLPVAIASSSPETLINVVVDVLEIREHFGHIYSAQHELYGKPHPGVFIKVAEHFGVSPSNCIVFEDSPSGVLAAKAAKMHCIAVPERAFKFHPFIQTADIVLQSLEQFDEAMLAKF